MLRLRISLVAGLLAGLAGAADDFAGKPVLVVLDFDSPWDQGKTGRFVASNFRAKITRYKLFITTEDVDREQIQKDAGFKPSFEVDRKELHKFCKKWLDADMVMWGKVEQAGGEQLRICARVLDRKAGPERLKLDTAAVVANKYATQVAVFEILSKLTGLKISKYPPLPADAEERWKKGPNLVGSDGLEKGTKHPEGWEPFGVDWQMKQAHWEKHPDEPGKCIVFRMSKGVAAMEGVAYYTRFFDVEPGATYRVRLRVKSMGPTVKVFVKYYAWLHTVGEPEGQWREVGRSPMNCRGPKKQWGWHQRDCHPRVYETRAKRVYHTKKCRIGLYAYWPEGVVYFDDVVFKKIGDAPKETKPFAVDAAGRKPFERKE